ncbi:MAG: hypothetical protein KJZ93_15395 [Caldilineaceae bacterium]|nr:hypothetical protein [Caldilineaceae bacterium]
MRTRMTSRRILSIVLALILCAVPVLVVAQDATDSVTVGDQESDGASVTIASVTAAAAGWIVIHLDADGRPGPVIGQSAVEAGENTDVVVALDPPLEEETALWAMLHVDEGVVGEYEFPGPDGPVRDGEMIVMTPFTAMVAVSDAAMDEEAADEEAADEEATDEEAADEEAADEEAADEEAADEEAADEEAADEEAADEEAADEEAADEEMDEGEAPELLPVTGAGLAGAAAQAIPAALAVAGALAGGLWVNRRRQS